MRPSPSTSPAQGVERMKSPTLSGKPASELPFLSQPNMRPDSLPKRMSGTPSPETSATMGEASEVCAPTGFGHPGSTLPWESKTRICEFTSELLATTISRRPSKSKSARAGDGETGLLELGRLLGQPGSCAPVRVLTTFTNPPSVIITTSRTPSWSTSPTAVLLRHNDPSDLGKLGVSEPSAFQMCSAPFGAP